MIKLSSFQLRQKKIQNGNVSDDASQPNVVEIKGTISSDNIFARLERDLALGRYENISYESVGMSRAT